MESAIAAEAARLHKAKDLLLMLDAIERMEPQTTDTPEAEEADEAFHMAILEAAHNPVLSVFGQLIAGQIKHKRKANISTPVERISALKKEHRSIYQSIEKGNPESARKQVYEHIMSCASSKK